MRRGRAVGILLLAAAIAPWANRAGAATVPEPTGYRAAPYLAPVPETVRGALTIDTATARQLHAAGAPFIDVFPRKARPEGLPPGTIFREPPHLSIPGAIWLHDTGYEALSPVEDARLRDGLAAASGGDRAAVMVIFCRRDCWLSWNAARRAAAMGYTGIRWFPEGVEGWQEAGGALAPVTAP